MIPLTIIRLFANGCPRRPSLDGNKGSTRPHCSSVNASNLLCSLTGTVCSNPHPTYRRHALAIGPLATLIFAAIANKRHKTRQNRVYIEDAHRMALEYWRVREALRVDLQAGHVRCDEARYHLTNTWLGGYFVNAPAVPMAWTIHRPGITQG